MNEEIDFTKLLLVTKDSVETIRAIKNGDYTDGGGDLERNATYLENALATEGFKDTLSSDDELLLRSAIREARG